MSSLIILGNINPYTFGNSIVSANLKSQAVFNSPLEKIFIIHSKESQKKLEEDRAWMDFIQKFGIHEDCFVQHTLSLTNQEKDIKRFVEYIEFILKGLGSKDKLILDITNGTTIQKNILSTLSYVLDIEYQFMIDIQKIPRTTTQPQGFIEDTNILINAYTHAPNNTMIDKIAYLNLSEVYRYKKIIEEHTQNFQKIAMNDAKGSFFKQNLEKSIELKLKGDLNQDNALYRIATASIASSMEELMSVLIKKFIGHNHNHLTLGQKIKLIEKEIKLPKDFDADFFERFNDFILYLRNSTTHKTGELTIVEKFKAELSVKMAFPYLEFYTNIIYPILSQKINENEADVIIEVDFETETNKTYYYALDGDDTGKTLENLFTNTTDEKKFKKTSEGIKKAIATISSDIKKLTSKDAVIFEAGDDLLFKGHFTMNELRNFQSIYTTETKGLTCSIGIGKTLLEVYLSLKLAKSQALKNSIKSLTFNAVY